jgi:tRNA threonylcarbamoyladenosine modification (KEOPS) complex  Pcc1 subunit
MSVKAKASISLKFCNPNQLAAMVTALKPETDSPVAHRASVNLQVQDCFLVLTIDAKDTVALRATINTYLRWIASIVNIMATLVYIDSFI